METKTRVLIADPNEDFRLMMSEILSAEEDLEVAGCAADTRACMPASASSSGGR